MHCYRRFYRIIEPDTFRRTSRAYHPPAGGIPRNTNLRYLLYRPRPASRIGNQDRRNSTERIKTSSQRASDSRSLRIIYIGGVSPGWGGFGGCSLGNVVDHREADHGG